MNEIELVFLILASFIPPIIYVVWIRNTEKFNREKWRVIFYAFIWGATIAVAASIILELILHYSIVPSINPSINHILAVVVIAPFAEELTKPIALKLKSIKLELQEPEDGLIYGAVVGLGFSATENLLYGNAFFIQGYNQSDILLLMLIRSVGGCLLHASATAWTGYGIGLSVINKKGLLSIIPYFILAILIHAIYNGLLVFDLLGAVFGLFTAITFSIITISIVRKKIIGLDSRNGG